MAAASFFVSTWGAIALVRFGLRFFNTVIR